MLRGSKSSTVHQEIHLSKLGRVCVCQIIFSESYSYGALLFGSRSTFNFNFKSHK